jgi:3-oxoacyl-ACP reductase-like protein
MLTRFSQLVVEPVGEEEPELAPPEPAVDPELAPLLAPGAAAAGFASVPEPAAASFFASLLPSAGADSVAPAPLFGA